MRRLLISAGISLIAFPCAAASLEELKAGQQFQAQLNFVRASIAVASDKEIKRRLASAELVVYGRVSRVWDPGEHNGGENDPDWRLALIQVGEILKGDSFKSVLVAFPGSGDIRWYRSPRFTAGQEGIWILRHAFELQTPDYTALDPLDYQPTSELERIKKLCRMNL